MSGTEITIDGPDGPFMAYCAAPGSAAAGVVVVLQEIFGINANIRGICDGLAQKGFLAVAPDLFWRIEPGIQLDPKVEAQMQRAFDLYGQFDVEAGMKDIAATVAAARALPGANGKVGAVGYCLGGLLAYLTATRTDAEAAVGYYGVGIQTMLGEAAAITGDLVLHVAEEDGFVPKEAQAAMREGLEANPKVTLHFYAGMDHAFARKGGEHYDADAATLADDRTLAFLKSRLA